MVDDDPGILKFVSRLLAGGGYHILTASSGAAALQQSKDHKGEIHLLLSDFQMPAMSGIELATQMSVERPQLKVLMMSGFTGGMLVLNEGWHFLTKPFIPSQLRALILGLVFPDRASKFSNQPPVDNVAGRFDIRCRAGGECHYMLQLQIPPPFAARSRASTIAADGGHGRVGGSWQRSLGRWRSALRCPVNALRVARCPRLQAHSSMSECSNFRLRTTQDTSLGRLFTLTKPVALAGSINSRPDASRR